MFVHRTLLLIIFILFFFASAITDWLYNVQEAWYRPYLFWLAAILAVALSTPGSNNREL